MYKFALRTSSVYFVCSCCLVQTWLFSCSCWLVQGWLQRLTLPSILASVQSYWTCPATRHQWYLLVLYKMWQLQMTMETTGQYWLWNKYSLERTSCKIIWSRIIPMTGKCYAMHGYGNQLAAANLMWLLCQRFANWFNTWCMHCWPRNCSVFCGA